MRNILNPSTNELLGLLTPGLKISVCIRNRPALIQVCLLGAAHAVFDDTRRRRSQRPVWRANAAVKPPTPLPSEAKNGPANPHKAFQVKRQYFPGHRNNEVLTSARGTAAVVGQSLDNPAGISQAGGSGPRAATGRAAPTLMRTPAAPLRRTGRLLPGQRSGPVPDTHRFPTPWPFKFATGLLSKRVSGGGRAARSGRVVEAIPPVSLGGRGGGRGGLWDGSSDGPSPF